MASLDAKQSLRGRVIVIEPMGHASIVVIEFGVGRISVLVPSDRVPELGAAVGVNLASARIHLFSSDGTNLLVGLGGSWKT